MPGYDLVVAMILLSGPPDVPEVVPPRELFAGLSEAIRAVALREEILDPREARYTLTDPARFAEDLDRLRARRRDLADAPRVGEAYRFPDYATAQGGIAFNRAFRRALEGRIPFEVDRESWLQSVIWEADQNYRSWDHLRDARTTGYYVTARRQALRALRALIGEDAWAAGAMPPAAPYHRFNDLGR